MTSILDFSTVSIPPQNPAKNDNDKKTYSVEKAIFETKNGEREYFLILRDGIPAGPINRAYLLQQCNQAHPCATACYEIAAFLNAQEKEGRALTEIRLSDVRKYLDDIYVHEKQSYRTLVNNILHIGNMFAELIKLNVPLDQSLTNVNYSELTHIRIKRDYSKLTTIFLLVDEYLPTVKGGSKYILETYTKWYSTAQIEAILEELSSAAYKCIFLLTVTLGHRIDMALSILRKDLDLVNGTLKPDRSKTGLTHLSKIPPRLLGMLSSYISDVRPAIVAKTNSMSPYLFIGRNGKEVTYDAYDKALKAAAKRVMQKNPELGLDKVHTHAGRSTFAAALRTYQLACQQQGIPTLSDNDFCSLMDWKNLKSLQYYDLVTRSLRVSPLLREFYEKFNDFAEINRLNCVTKPEVATNDQY